MHIYNVILYIESYVDSWLKLVLYCMISPYHPFANHTACLACCLAQDIPHAICPAPRGFAGADERNGQRVSCGTSPNTEGRWDFQQWPEVNPGDWSFADFGEMFAYLRGNRHLIIPEEWRGTIPDRL